MFGFFKKKDQKEKNNVEFTEDGYASVVRNIHGEELKNELLSQEDIEIEINEVKKEGNNIILYSTIRDLYYQNNYSSAEKFDVEVIVNKDTLVLASGVLATTSSPEVSLSMRCTSPRRGSFTS